MLTVVFVVIVLVAVDDVFAVGLVLWRAVCV